MDIMLDLERLRQTRSGLEAALAAFDTAADVNNDLEDAVDRPDDRTALRNKVGDFESAWNRKRDKLSENLTGIRDQLASIIDGWSEWDTSTAADLDNAGVTQQGANIPMAR